MQSFCTFYRNFTKYSLCFQSESPGELLYRRGWAAITGTPVSLYEVTSDKRCITTTKNQKTPHTALFSAVTQSVVFGRWFGLFRSVSCFCSSFV